MKVHLLSRIALFTICFLLCSELIHAQGLDKAANEFNNQMSKVKPVAKTALGTIAFILGSIGAVKALNKSTVEDENAAKGYMKWLAGASFFAVAWGVMQFFFT